ncbi:MAG TPA: DnaD domain protein [Dehalococcoidia bacterium]|nr:DnaD domain protein [Dehalococcoidia bacterium]
MKQFEGFPHRAQFTPLPNAFFSRLLPQISDIAELKVTLHVFQALYQKKGYPRFTSYLELLGNKSLMDSLKSDQSPPDEILRNALEMATRRGTILHLALDRDGKPEDIYLVSDEQGRRTMARIESGTLKLDGLELREPALIDDEEPLDIFTLYEQSIGILDPLTSDHLRDALQTYPENWVKDAIKEAVALNKRSWRYIEKILERWTAEGRGDGTYKRDSEKTDPNRYLKQKYGNIIQR